MPTLVTNSTHLGSASTRGIYTLVGATLVVASVLPDTYARHWQGIIPKSPSFFERSNQLTPNTGHYVKKEIVGQEAALLGAFYDVFSSLLQSQTELDSDTRRLLNAQLWNLYE
jgi:hypothetical protein